MIINSLNINPVDSQKLAAWRLAALLFECPRDGWQAEVDALVNEASEPLLAQAAQEARSEAHEGLFHTTFGPGGPAASREVSYRTSVLPGEVLGRLCSLYKAFAYHPAVTEAPDHVAVEVGCVAYLRLKAAYARFRDDPEQGAIAEEAAERLVAEHLRTFAVPLARSLEASGTRYLTLAARWLAAQAGAPPDPPGPSPWPEDNDAVQCAGSCDRSEDDASFE